MRVLWGLIGLLAICGVGLAALGWQSLHTPLDSKGSEIWVKVPRGASVQQIESTLVSQGILGRRVPWAWFLRLSGRDRSIRSGTFALSPSQTPLEILAQLAEGRTVLLAVTLPEGLTEQQSLARLHEALGVPLEDLRRAAGQARDGIEGARRTGSLDGYLFPETYHFEHETPAAQIMQRLLGALLEFYDRDRQLAAADLGFSLHEVLTLASIIEAETARPEERTRISAVYHNRLRRGMLLQADPTVAFATGRIGQPLWYKHLSVASPYNTYLHAGLPPGPINSPGRASIDAALHPLEGCQDLFFVARGDGTHIFTRNLEEHERAKRQARAGR